MHGVPQRPASPSPGMHGARVPKTVLILLSQSSDFDKGAWTHLNEDDNMHDACRMQGASLPCMHTNGTFSKQEMSKNETISFLWDPSSVIDLMSICELIRGQHPSRIEAFELICDSFVARSANNKHLEVDFAATSFLGQTKGT